MSRWYEIGDRPAFVFAPGDGWVFDGKTALVNPPAVIIEAHAWLHTLSGDEIRAANERIARGEPCGCDLHKGVEP